jgi:HlyD family secretion protein
MVMKINVLTKYLLYAGLAVMAASCKDGNGAATASGTFEAEEITVSAEASGKLVSFTVREGQEVSEGQVLGQIDSLSLYLNKELLEQNIAALETGKPDVEAQIGVMKARLENGRHELDRLSRLLESDAATRKQYDDAEASVSVLEKQIEATESSLNSNIASIDAQIAGLKIQIAQAEDMLSKCRIVSPVDGTVLSKYAHEGELASAGKPLFKVADLEHVFLRAYFTSGQLKDISLGQDVKVTADFGGGKVREYPGKIVWISAKSEFTPKSIQTDDDRENLVYAVKVAVENDGYIKIGMFGKVTSR